MHIFYRTSDSGYNKVKPDYITNENCWRNFLQHFPANEITLICDNVSNQSWEKWKNEQVHEVVRTNAGSSAGGFNLCLDRALKLDDQEVCYFVENDYCHFSGAREVLLEAFNELKCGYASAYDHPDKYLPMYEGGEITRVYLTKSCHWKLTISTTMTFAAKVSTLKEDEDILRKFTVGSYPQDHQMFIALRQKGRSLVTPIPGYSSHGEQAWLSPLRNWKQVMNATLLFEGRYGQFDKEYLNTMFDDWNENVSGQSL